MGQNDPFRRSSVKVVIWNTEKVFLRVHERFTYKDFLQTPLYLLEIRFHSQSSKSANVRNEMIINRVLWRII